MNKKGRKRLLAELDTLEELLELRECEQGNSLPFALVFKLYKQDLPIDEIAHRARLDYWKIVDIVHGNLTIPKDKIKAVEQLGLKICGCCRCRIVPIELFDHVQLTTLCQICWKRGDDSGDVCPNKLHIKAEEVI